MKVKTVWAIRRVYYGDAVGVNSANQTFRTSTPIINDVKIDIACEF